MSTSWARTLRRLDAFQKVDSAYQARTSSGGFLSVVVILTMLFMVFSEVRDYMQYKEEHSFTIDGNMHQKLQINVGMVVGMPCGLVRVDVLDESGTSENVHSSIKALPVSKNSAFARVQGAGAFHDTGDRHVHDIVAEARRKQRAAAAIAAPKQSDILADGACRIEGSVLVNKISGLLHITAHGHGHSGAHVPHYMMNFTHYIEELSFGPLYPSLVNPLDDTMHVALEHFAGFRYFISVVPTNYIDANSRFLPTNQYAVNEYYKSQTDHSEMDSKPPGIFFEYNIEPIAVTIREKRGSFITFVVRVCAGISGMFVTVGLIHSFISSISNAAVRPSAYKRPSSQGLLGSGSVTKADIDAPLSL
ncbi:hypothetical protein GGI12_002110 [Dipsacomyces acuminosporus]|nr:hypothetical protein GGI12_002110 [Dipsacomyces acuminosporus]